MTSNFQHSISSGNHFQAFVAHTEEMPIEIR